MDHKAWLWRKKSSEKTTVATEKANLSAIENEEVLIAEKEELEKELKKRSDELALALSDCDAKDELVKKQTKIAQEAVAGWEKVETEALCIKQELDVALQQRLVYEERVAHLDGALKECMHQLRFVREEQEKRIHDAVMKASNEFAKARMALEEQLSETSKRLAKAGVENAHFSQAILAKENIIGDLNRQLNQSEADYNALMSRLESTEKDNASLKYEVRVLEKELEIRNEEREFNRRTADASHKQHLDSVKKIAKLESECQRLRLLVRKRLPGPAALAKMKNEVEMLGWDSGEMRRKKLNSTGNSVIESTVESSPEALMKRINIVTEQLFAVEEENKTLKESLHRKTNELQFSRTMLVRTASKLSQMESRLEESSRSQVIGEQPTNSLSLTSHEFSLASMSDIGSDDKASCAESWASALISELEHFRSEKKKGSLSCTSVGASDINLMDDFVEMEKLAIISVEKAPEISHSPSKTSNGVTGLTEAGPNGSASEVVGKEIIPMSENMSDLTMTNQKTGSDDISNGNIPSWLHDVLKVVLEQKHVTHRNPDDIVEDIRVALRNFNLPGVQELDSSKRADHIDPSNAPNFSNHISWKPSSGSLTVDPSNEVTDAEISSIKRSRQFQPELSKSIGRIIELIEGISIPSVDYDNSDSSYKNLGMPMGYMARIFQWKTSELSNVLQQFLHACYDLLNGKADHENFVKELTTTLDWILNHCFSLQDVSSMKDAIKKQFDWDETRSEGETDIGMISHFARADNLHLPREQLPCSPLGTTSDHGPVSDVKEEFKNIEDRWINAESEKKVLEGKLHSATNKVESLLNQLHESENSISDLRSELRTLKESNGILQDQIQNHKLIDDAPVTEAELKEAQHMVLTLEAELENKNHRCEDLESRYLELQLQLESMTKECSDHDIDRKEKPLRTDWEITAASEKLAECQETILNLGKQLKALAAPKDASLFDKVIANQSNTVTSTDTATSNVDNVNVDPSTVPSKEAKLKNRSSLLDQMLAEDDTKAEHLKTAKEDDRNTSSATIPGFIKPSDKVIVVNGMKEQDDSVAVNSLAVVPLPTKKRGNGSLWKKLWRNKRNANKKTSNSFTK